MLIHLAIENIALIEKTEIDFKSGLTVLTGETGAGKTIIIEALNFVLGSRADKNLIRYGCNTAKASAVFEINSELVFEQLDALGIEKESTLIISRTLNIDGKSECRLNGQILSLNMLKQITSLLVDIHGQHEHQQILKEKFHIKVLDNFIGAGIFDLTEKLSVKLQNLKSINEKLSFFGGSQEERLRSIDLYSYQIKEIEDAKLQADEEDVLKERRRVLLQSEKIKTALNSILHNNGNENALCLLKSAQKMLSAINTDKTEKLSQRIKSSAYEIDDIFAEMNMMFDEMSAGESALEEIERRLDLIADLKRKTKTQKIQELLNYLQKIVSERDLLLTGKEQTEKLLKQKTVLLDEIFDICKQLNAQRVKGAEKLSSSIISELADLGIKNANFAVNFKSEPNREQIEQQVSENGTDDVEFLFSANLGQPAKQLSKVISGGEMSRLMLAIKNITNFTLGIETFVFDEIDSGISGQIGKVVAEKMHKISKYAQVLAITHLPQIAAMCDNHFYIEKYTENNSTKTKLSLLTRGERICEISRLSGGNVGEYSLLHSEEMLKSADSFKNC